jgi:hypothetical protein
VNAKIGYYDMDNIILDITSDVNVLLKKAWEITEKLKLIWSLVQLRLANQHKIVSIGILLGVIVNIDGVHSVDDFEVIDIMDNSHPYLALLVLDSDFDNQTIINLKQREIIFEGGGLKFTTPLYPTKERMYVEPSRK